MTAMIFDALVGLSLGAAIGSVGVILTELGFLSID